MSHEPLVTVIIPVFNARFTVERAIQSVLSQTVRDLEIIVIDDGSNDGSGDVARKMALKTVSIAVINQNNRGVAEARNRGIKEARGQFIAFLDADDRWLPKKLEVQLQYIQRHDVSFVGSKNSAQSGFGNLSYCFINYRQQLFRNHFQPSTVLVSKAMLNQAGLFPVGRRYAEEGDLFFRLLAVKPAIFINECLSIYGDDKNSFGESGLSGNVKAMWYGEIENYFNCWKRKEIGVVRLSFFLTFSLFKHLRRIVLCRVSSR